MCGFYSDRVYFKHFFACQGAVNFALMMSQMEGGCPVDYNTVTDLFLQVQLKFYHL